MSDYEYITVEGQDIVTVTLNRPDIHNPFDDKMIKELTHCFEGIQARQEIRAVVITGAGKSFCAGADLNWMKRMGQYSQEENLADAKGLSAMFNALENVEVPVIARVNGAALGGGAGLVCACDFAIASERVKMGFSEVKLGLLPGVISPYVIDRIGMKKAIQLFMTGERLEAEAALEVGLVDKVVSLEGLDMAVGQLIDQIISGGPEAVKACKLLARTGSRMELLKFKEYCINAIAGLRASPEGKEGVSSFLEKREPNWRAKP